MNSRNKGARGEREAAKYLTKLGFDTERNGRNGYSTDDLRCPGLPNVHVEVKFGYASMDIHTACLRKAWEQAAAGCDWVRETPDSAWERDRMDDPTPVVLWRPLRKPWRLTWMGPNGLCTTTGDDEVRSTLLELNGAAHAAERY